MFALGFRRRPLPTTVFFPSTRQGLDVDGQRRIALDELLFLERWNMDMDIEEEHVFPDFKAPAWIWRVGHGVGFVPCRAFYRVTVENLVDDLAAAPLRPGVDFGEGRGGAPPAALVLLGQGFRREDQSPVHPAGEQVQPRRGVSSEAGAPRRERRGVSAEA